MDGIILYLLPFIFCAWQWAMGNGQWAMGIGHWALGMGHWEKVLFLSPFP